MWWLSSIWLEVLQGASLHFLLCVVSPVLGSQEIFVEWLNDWTSRRALTRLVLCCILCPSDLGAWGYNFLSYNVHLWNQGGSCNCHIKQRFFLQKTAYLVIQSYNCCSATKSCSILCDLMDYSMPGFPVLHYLPESAQIHAHWVGHVIHYVWEVKW